MDFNEAPLVHQRLHRSTIPFLHFACEHEPEVVCADMCVSVCGKTLLGVIFKTVICILYYHSTSLFLGNKKEKHIGWAKSRYTVINYILYTYFWPILYVNTTSVRLCDLVLTTKLLIQF